MKNAMQEPGNWEPGTCAGTWFFAQEMRRNGLVWSLQLPTESLTSLLLCWFWGERGRHKVPGRTRWSHPISHCPRRNLLLNCIFSHKVQVGTAAREMSCHNDNVCHALIVQQSLHVGVVKHLYTLFEFVAAHVQYQNVWLAHGFNVHPVSRQ